MIQAQEKPFHPPRRSFTETDRDEIVRQTLKEIEERMNAVSVNPTYRQAFNIVGRILRGMRP